MRYLVTFFWCIVLGQVVGYIGSSLSHGTYNFTLTTILSLIVGVCILLISAVAAPPKSQTSK